MDMHQALIELKTMLDAKIDEFRERIAINSAYLDDLKAMLHAEFDEFREDERLTESSMCLTELIARPHAKVDEFSLDGYHGRPVAYTDRTESSDGGGVFRIGGV
jgi:hypothetical protein